MHATLELQAAVRPDPVHLEDHLAQPADPGLARREHLHAPAMPLGIPRVHAKQIRGEQRRFLAAGASADLDDHVALVKRIVWEQLDLQNLQEPRLLRFQSVHLVARHLAQLRVRLLVAHPANTSQLQARGLHAVPRVHGRLDPRQLLPNAAQRVGVRGHLRARELLVQPLGLERQLGQAILEPHASGSSSTGSGSLPGTPAATSDASRSAASLAARASACAWAIVRRAG